MYSKILEAYSIEIIQKQIDGHIENGYSPQGGIAVRFDERARITTYTILMVKYEPNSWKISK